MPVTATAPQRPPSGDSRGERVVGRPSPEGQRLPSAEGQQRTRATGSARGACAGSSRDHFAGVVD